AAEPSQFPDGKVIGAGDNGTPSEKFSPHVFGDRDTRNRRLNFQFFVLCLSDSYRAAARVFGDSLPHFFCLIRARSEAPSARSGSPEGAALWQVEVAGGSQLPTCKFLLPSQNEISRSA
ncbi:MAG: hypothetical protein K2N07_01275, partial [Desulfovibrio sp.]|nr:hypothetical protein [Desulfovibrio sp.]